VCAVAAEAADIGQLDYATTLYASIPATAPRDCVVRGLHRIAILRQLARDKVSSGQQDLVTGNVRNAQKDFRAALALDNSNSAAQQGMSRVAQFGPPNSPVFSWDNFYATRVEIAYRFLGAFAVSVITLLLLSSLASRWLVKVDAVAWPQSQRRWTKTLAALLVIGTSALLPIYPMFKPFMAEDFSGWLLALVLLTIGILFLALWIWSYRRLTHACDRGVYRRQFFWVAWRPLVIVLLSLLVVTVGLWFVWWNQAYPRLLLTAGAVLVLAVVITAVSFGQDCRVQVQALGASGRSDERSTDYFLARIQTLGREKSQGLTAASASSAMTSLVSQDLSTIPAGFMMGMVARIAFTLRPDMTWRAQVTRFDANRVAMRLSRNGRLAATTVFSRTELSLAPVKSGGLGNSNETKAGDDNDIEAGGQMADQAGAQLVTGAAAFVLLHLSTVYPEYRKGLCGATNWKSVTLQAIAASEALSDGEDGQSLLYEALELDPGNGRARYDYINKRAADLPPGSLYDKMKVDMFQDLIKRSLADKMKTDSPDKPKFGWAELYLRILCSASVVQIDQRIETQRASGHIEADSNVPSVADLTDALTDRCEKIAEGKVKESDGCTLLRDKCVVAANDDNSATARKLLPYAKNFKEFADLLDGGKVIGRHEYEPYGSPGLCYNYAVLRALAADELRRKRQEVPETLIDELFNNLAFAVGSAKMRNLARKDEVLATMSYDRRFFDLVGKPQFLDVKPFALFRDKLAAAGLTTATRFLQATHNATARTDLAKNLNVPAATVDYLRGFAEISQMHAELEDPRMLNILADQGVETAAQLEKRVQEKKFLDEVKKATARQGLESRPTETLPEVAEPLPEWVEAVRNRTARSATKRTAARKTASKRAPPTGNEA